MSLARSAPSSGFIPGPDNAAEFRSALGRFATGVTIVSTRDAEGRAIGMTANSFASVSLDPPLVLWSPARRSARFELFSQAATWSIAILESSQEALARHFTRNGHWPEGMDNAAGAEGLPVLPGCLARFDCRAESRHSGGDHEILVGRVIHAHAVEGSPLLFLGGRFGGFHEAPAG